MLRLVSCSLACSLLAVGCHGASTSSNAPPDAAVAPPCTFASTETAMDSFAASDVDLHVESNGDAGLEIVRKDLATYLGTLWGGTFTASTNAPDFSHRLTIWASTSTDAKTLAGFSGTTGYAITRVDAQAGTTIVVAANDDADLAFGTYALLEELGIRFFHPKQELVPTFDGPRVPTTLGISRSPAVVTRGLQPHTLHPIEYFKVLNEPGDQNLADAKLLIDWLVKTGQNYVQWPLLSTVDFASWKPHAEAIIAYAHSRGVRVGAVVQVFGGAALQNNYLLIADTTQPNSQMDGALDQLMNLQWDVVELALGEFVAEGAQEVIDVLDYAVAHLAALSPTLEINVQNHVGNYPQLFVQYQGQTVYYYQLPQFADPRLGQTVHTLSIFDLYRDWGTYKEPNFFFQHDYILQELPSRRVSYFPESAYWISADIDVPLFLPETIYSRWNDIHTLLAETQNKGLPQLEGHVMFSSGHEWNYWLTDYLTAKMLWQPDADLDTFVSHYGDAYGSCATDITSSLDTLIQLQNTYLFDQRLFAYVQGENGTVAFGYIAGLETHPQRIAYETVLAMSAADRASFESTVVEPLEAMATQMQPIEDDLAQRCPASDAAIVPWCNELWDGVEIVRVRAQHAAHLYRSVLDKANGGDGESELAAARTLSALGLTVVARREAGYRFDLSRMVDDYDNPTIYPFGYLRTAHTLCYWGRQEEQARSLIEDGVALEITDLPSCED